MEKRSKYKSIVQLYTIPCLQTYLQLKKGKVGRIWTEEARQHSNTQITVTCRFQDVRLTLFHRLKKIGKEKRNGQERRNNVSAVLWNQMRENKIHFKLSEIDHKN